MRISLFESDDAFFKIVVALLSVVACKTVSLDINTPDLLLNDYIDYKFLPGEIYEKFPLVVIFLSGADILLMLPSVATDQRSAQIKSASFI
jgi:hypothetical protein